MSESVLERRPLYAIGTVARLTGLKPDTLRVWERRYGLGASYKSASGRRQYTQGDLEHLQMIAALVAGGTRIGEIASAGRKTLEALIRNVAGSASALPETKPRVAFVGPPLCLWLDKHQGCLAGVDALLVRASARELAPSLRERLADCDALVVFVSGLNRDAIDAAGELREALGARQLIVTYEFAGGRAESLAGAAGISAMAFPPDPARLAFELSRCVTEKLTRQGERDLGELVQARPREFSGRELAAAASLRSHLGCECPQHLAELVASLSHFERYSAECSAENWQDAALHARIYAFTAQARWLMERALTAALEEHETAFADALARPGLGDVA